MSKSPAFCSQHKDPSSALNIVIRLHAGSADGYASWGLISFYHNFTQTNLQAQIKEGQQRKTIIKNLKRKISEHYV